MATGCELSITSAAPDYADLRPDPALLTPYRANAEAPGRVFPDLPRGLDCAPAVNHQPEFTAACVTAAADRAAVTA